LAAVSGTDKPADPGGIWLRPLLLVALIECAYAVSTRAGLAQLFQGGELELVTSAVRLLTLALYWRLFRSWILSRRMQWDRLRQPTLLLGMLLLLLVPLFTGNDGRPESERWIFALTSFVVGLREELVYRAVVQNLLERRFGFMPAIISASALFACYHYGYAQIPFTPLRFLELFFSGVALGVVYRATGSLALAAALHAVLDVLWSLSPWIAAPYPQPVRASGLVLIAALLLTWFWRYSARAR
jgi:membrane protease YdiL (CAAX protease family)